jgi:hypothetical protein
MLDDSFPCRRQLQRDLGAVPSSGLFRSAFGEIARERSSTDDALLEVLAEDQD